jgi:hypothetical protein
METSKVYIHKNPEGMWEAGVVIPINGEETYINKHEASTWDELTDWVKKAYVG